MADPRIRQMKIQTGVVKRLAKEKTVYEMECVTQSARIEKMKSEGKDEYDIRKQGEVLQESQMMIPDTLKKLKEAYSKLSALLEEANELHGTAEYTTAQQQLNDTKSVVEA